MDWNLYCLPLPNRLEYFDNQSIKLVSGPVIFEYKKDIFYKLQTLEFLRDYLDNYTIRNRNPPNPHRGKHWN